MDPKVKALVDRNASRPRCCEWCDKRGFKAEPLVRLLVNTTDLGLLHWWVHKVCGEMLIEDSRVTSHEFIT